MPISLTGMRSVKVADFDISPHHPMQSFVRDAITGQWYVAQLNGTTDGVENLWVYRCAPDGAVLDKASLVKAGHGNSITIEHDGGSVYLWFRWTGIDKPVRWRYSGTVAGKTITSSHADVTQYTSLEPSNTSTAYYSIDEQAGRIASYRGQADGTHYLELRRLSDYKAGTGSALHTIDITDYGVMQGFATVGDQVLVYRGAGYTSTDQHPPEIRVYSWTTGAETGRLDVSGASGVNPGDASINEAEGIYVTPEGTIMHGLATGLMGTNVSTVYRLTSQSETVGEVGRATLVLDLQEVTGEPMGDASVQVSYDRTVRYKSGGVVPALPEKFIPLAKRDRVQVVASDDPDLHEDSANFRIVVSVQRGYPHGGDKYFAMVSVNNDAEVPLSRVLSNAAKVPAPFVNVDEFRQAAEDARDAAQSAAADTVALVQGDITAATTAAEAAATSATTAQTAAATSAQAAADAAALVDAPAKSAMDAAMGGDVAGLVDTVAQNRVGKALAATGNPTTDRTNLTSMLDTSATLGVPLTLTGNFDLAAQITVPAGAVITGHGATLKQTASRTTLLNVGPRVRISGLRMVGHGGDYADESGVYNAVAINCPSGAVDVKITDTTMTGFCGAGVQIQDGAADVDITGCTITGPGPTVIPADSFRGAGIRALCTTGRWSARNNDISGYAQGITCAEKQVAYQITGNRIHDIPGQHGLYLQSVTMGVISHNIVWNTRKLGMKVQIETPTITDPIDVIISSNVFKDCGDSGILLPNPTDVGGPPRLRRFIVSGNVVDNVGTAFVADGIVANNLIGAVITGNYVHAASRHGISLTDCGNVTVTSNTVEKPGQCGIIFAGATTDWRIGTNRVINSGQANAGPGTGFGIDVTGTCAEGAVIGNIVTSTDAKMRYGLRINTTCDQTTISVLDNDASGATDFGFRGNSGQTARAFRGNRFAGTSGPLLNPPSNFAALTGSSTVADIVAVLQANGLAR